MLEVENSIQLGQNYFDGVEDHSLPLNDSRLRDKIFINDGRGVLLWL